MKIGVLAKQADCPVETVRYYEREGLLPAPARTEGNYRLYSSEHLERLTFIRNCRTLDMTLDEIRRLLALMDSPARTVKASTAWWMSTFVMFRRGLPACWHCNNNCSTCVTAVLRSRAWRPVAFSSS